MAASRAASTKTVGESKSSKSLNNAEQLHTGQPERARSIAGQNAVATPATSALLMGTDPNHLRLARGSRRSPVPVLDPDAVAINQLTTFPPGEREDENHQAGDDNAD